MHHISAPPGTPAPIANVIEHGYVGVPLFFMLSGLVLAWNYPTLSVRGGRSLGMFYVARTARIMPLYWAVLGYVAVLYAARGLDLDHLWRHVLALQTWSGDLGVAYRFNAPGWSIGVELFLYACFPFLVPVVARLARRGDAALVALAGVCVVVQVALVLAFTAAGLDTTKVSDPDGIHRWLFRNPLPRLLEFTIGLSLAFLLHRGLRWSARRSALLASCAALAALVVAAMPTRWLHGAQYGAAYAVPFAVLLLALAANERAWPSRLLGSSAMVALGSASYALYLTHRPLLAGFGDNLAAQGPLAVRALLPLFVIALCMCVAEGAHRYLEVPARRALIRLGRRLIAPPRRTAPPTPTTEAETGIHLDGATSPQRVDVSSR